MQSEIEFVGLPELDGYKLPVHEGMFVDPQYRRIKQTVGAKLLQALEDVPIRSDTPDSRCAFFEMREGEDGVYRYHFEKWYSKESDEDK